ncbi:MAG: double-strand break repair protein AddB [Methyloceanibacter sp.]
MKVPDPRTAGLGLYTIPPTAPFLTTLARAILDGDLPLPGGPRPDPLTLPLTTLYLPTRRAARALREAFLAEAGGQALLLPRIRALGDPDEEAIIFGADDAEGDGLEGAAGAPAIDKLPRRLALMRLIFAWGRRLLHEDPVDRADTGMTLAQASYLAADLARLMDFIESEEVDLAAIEEIVPEELAGHWQITVDFLKIVTEHWPHYLADNGLVSPVARRNSLMALEAARLAAGSPHPVIAAGSTGTVPATARLLQIIASLPNGAVVLPGLDFGLDEDSWARLADHPEHPQAGMAELLRKLGASRHDVHYVPGSAPDATSEARLTFVSETFRPAETTELWERLLKDDAPDEDRDERAGDASRANLLPGVHLVVAPTAHDEAEAIALILRSCIEQKGKTAALVTPDRVLARRVAARLKQYRLAIDDSAGVPVSRTAPGAFLDLVLGAAEADFAPSALMALLKHPLTLLGRDPGGIRKAARALERGAFRDVYVGQGLSGARDALEAPRDEFKRKGSVLSPDEHAAALALVKDLEIAFAPLTKLFSASTPYNAADLTTAHAATAEALARDAEGSSSGLWQGDAGEALTVLLTELIDTGAGLAMEAADYPPFYRSLLAGQVVRPRGLAHPRLFIWGPLEARLQQPDLVILGSLNEGTWPRPQEAGPWLSRPMREALGLSPPERRTGLSAHDFAQALGAGTVYLTRAVKVEGVPTVPSRWLQRLLALVKAAKIEPEPTPGEPWVAWARMRDRVQSFNPVQPPEPRPPAEARPRKMSVTRIEKWIANPYEIFTRNILKLEPLKPLGAEPDAALRGSIVHRVMHEFATAYPDCLPTDIEGELVRIADAHLAVLGGSPRVEAFWRPHLQRFARWFAATEPARRAGMAATHTEITGELDLAVASGFCLTARADRIDIGVDGRAVIYDYKTGKPPLPTHVDRLFAPQLPLEAAIAEGGGFAGLDPRQVAGLRYIEASGRRDGGKDHAAANADTQILASKALADLKRLVERYADPGMAYEVKRRKGPAFANAYRYDEYAHLARVQEWLTQEEEEEW